MQFRDRHRDRPEVIRWINVYLRRHLSRPRLYRWTCTVDAEGLPKPERVTYCNTPDDVFEALYWLSRAGDHESGNFDAGGRRAQSAKAAACAGIVAHEVSVMLAKSQAEMKKGDRERG